MGEEQDGRRQEEEINKRKNGWGKKKKEKQTNKPKAFASAYAPISMAAEQCRCIQYGIGHVFPW